MRRPIATLLGPLMIALIMAASPALAESPIPREYPETGSERADPAKPADQRAREEAQANADEASCNAGNQSACSDLGEAYRFGAGRPQNRPVAELLYRRACDAADGAGCFRLANLLRSSGEDADKQAAVSFHTRACRLGAIEGCDAEADALAWGTLGEPDPAAAEALRRTTCNKGGREACRTLANELMARERSLAEQDEGRALIDRQCRAGDAAACSDAAEHWRLLIAPDSRARIADYERLGCAAGDAWLCIARAKRAMALSQGPAERAAALVFYESACALDRFRCSDAAQLRDEPALTASCDGGDQAACITLGNSLADPGSPLEDKPRALALLGAGCDAGVTEGCLEAARLLVGLSSKAAPPDPARLDGYLARACDAAQREACEGLADTLADGALLPQDIPRAVALYAPQCENGRDTACRFLEEQAMTDPAAPLMVAKANFTPELTPEEEAEDARLAREERARESAEDRLRNCTTTTVVFEGVSYTDTVCMNVTRVIGRGFGVRPGATPWQALVWRPPTLGRPATRGRGATPGRALSPQERVWCGGSVIREGWVLTAGHCLNDSGMGGESIQTAGHRIRLGLTNAFGDEGFSYPIIATFRHPNYDRQVLAFDIALVQYDPKRGTRGSTAQAPARIRLDPVPLGGRKIEAIPRVSTYGWGLTAVLNGTISDQLRGARMTLRDAASCTNVTKFTDDLRRDSVLCADELKGAEGGQACGGDSGGPLITYSDADKVPTLIGVVSGGVDCGTAKLPSRYIRVAHPRVQEWLKKVLPPARSR